MCGNKSMDKVSLYNCKACDFDACKCMCRVWILHGNHLLLESGCDSNEACMKQATFFSFGKEYRNVCND